MALPKLHPLRRLRFELGDLSQGEFARLLGVSQGEVSKWEAAGREIKEKLPNALSEVFGLSDLDVLQVCNGTISESNFKKLILSISSSRGGNSSGQAHGNSNGDASPVDASSIGDAGCNAIDDSGAGRIPDMPRSGVEDRTRLSAAGSGRTKELGASISPNGKGVHSAG